MPKLSFFRGKMAAVLNDDYYNVKALPATDDELVEDTAYIVGSSVLPFKGKVESLSAMKDYGLYILDNKLTAHRPDPNKDDTYSTDRIIALDISKVLDKVKAEGFLSNEDVERINSASDFKGFDIRPDDDFLSILVKTVINMKKIDPKVYASRLPKKHKMSNMIKSLKGGTDMSMHYFMTWKELLEIDFDIMFRDSVDSTLPLNHTLYIDSEENEVRLDVDSVGKN